MAYLHVVTSLRINTKPIKECDQWNDRRGTVSGVQRKASRLHTHEGGSENPLNNRANQAKVVICFGSIFKTIDAKRQYADVCVLALPSCFTVSHLWHNPSRLHVLQEGYYHITILRIRHPESPTYGKESLYARWYFLRRTSIAWFKTLPNRSGFLTERPILFNNWSARLTRHNSTRDLTECNHNRCMLYHVLLLTTVSNILYWVLKFVFGTQTVLNCEIYQSEAVWGIVNETYGNTSKRRDLCHC